MLRHTEHDEIIDSIENAFKKTTQRLLGAIKDRRDKALQMQIKERKAAEKLKKERGISLSDLEQEKKKLNIAEVWIQKIDDSIQSYVDGQLTLKKAGDQIAKVFLQLSDDTNLNDFILDLEKTEEILHPTNYKKLASEFRRELIVDDQLYKQMTLSYNELKRQKNSMESVMSNMKVACEKSLPTGTGTKTIKFSYNILATIGLNVEELDRTADLKDNTPLKRIEKLSSKIRATISAGGKNEISFAKSVFETFKQEWDSIVKSYASKNTHDTDILAMITLPANKEKYHYERLIAIGLGELLELNELKMDAEEKKALQDALNNIPLPPPKHKGKEVNKNGTGVSFRHLTYEADKVEQESTFYSTYKTSIINFVKQVNSYNNNINTIQSVDAKKVQETIKADGQLSRSTSKNSLNNSSGIMRTLNASNELKNSRDTALTSSGGANKKLTSSQEQLSLKKKEINSKSNLTKSSEHTDSLRASGNSIEENLARKNKITRTQNFYTPVTTKTKAIEPSSEGNKLASNNDQKRTTRPELKRGLAMTNLRN